MNVDKIKEDLLASKSVLERKLKDYTNVIDKLLDVIEDEKLLEDLMAESLVFETEVTKHLQSIEKSCKEKIVEKEKNTPIVDKKEEKSEIPLSITALSSIT